MDALGIFLWAIQFGAVALGFYYVLFVLGK
jgi:hypothetical protein